MYIIYVLCFHELSKKAFTIQLRSTIQDGIEVQFFRLQGI